ncbi:MAG TPA: hypothetical protein VFN30_02790 [Chitinophagaceae bacterium]|nr:hypothetical protein [Chitinophagaceae bacterium]
MKKRYFNQKVKKKAKANLTKNMQRARRFLKRIGGIIDVSVLVENRDANAMDASEVKKMR